MKTDSGKNIPIKLIKGVNVYAPEPMGKNDVLITGNTIAYIDKKIELQGNIDIQTISGKDRILVPGFIDSHVHILGGGGEGGFKTRTPEIMLGQLIKAGITTVIGCLGTDGITRSMSNLVAKARGLTEEGISCYCYTGNYHIPVKTLSGSIQEDLVNIDRIIGVGEIALSDHRSSQPTFDELARLAADARVGGMLSGKSGVVDVHMGSGPRHLELLERIVKETEIPYSQFLPTHIGRSPGLFQAAMRWAINGGTVDLTTSSMQIIDKNEQYEDAALALQVMLMKGVPDTRITLSSDAQGSLPTFDSAGNLTGFEIGSALSILETVQSAVKMYKIKLESVLRTITQNPARVFKFKNKGRIIAGYDADMLLLDNELNIQSVIAGGRIMMHDSQLLVKGTFE